MTTDGSFGRKFKPNAFLMQETWVNLGSTLFTLAKLNSDRCTMLPSTSELTLFVVNIIILTQLWIGILSLCWSHLTWGQYFLTNSIMWLEGHQYLWQNWSQCWFCLYGKILNLIFILNYQHQINTYWGISKCSFGIIPGAWTTYPLPHLVPSLCLSSSFISPIFRFVCRQLNAKHN